MAQHHIVEIRAQGFRGEADDFGAGRTPPRSTFSGSLLAGASRACQTGVIARQIAFEKKSAKTRGPLSANRLKYRQSVIREKRTRLPTKCHRWATTAALVTAAVLPSVAQAQQSDSSGSDTPPIVTKAPAVKTQTEDAASFDAKFTAAVMSNNIFRGYTLSNNFPSVTGTLEATYSIFFDSVNGAWVQIPRLSHFQLTNTIGLRPTFGKLTVESGFAYYSYPNSAQDLSYGEIYLAPNYEITSKLTLGLSTYYGPNYYRSGAWENYNAVSGKYDLGHGLTLSAELGRQNFGTTAETPPVKLPDYIYGNVGATYTYKALSFDLRFHGTTLSRQSCFLITGTGSRAGSNGCQPTIVGMLSWNGAWSELKSAFGAAK
jgi:uncharacterized protein (TIGR02001 family)